MAGCGGNVGHRPLLLMLPLAMVVAVAVWQLLRPAWMPGVPDPEGWLDAARHVQSRWQAGDVVRIEPTWLTAGRVYFGDVDGGPRAPLRVLDLHAPIDLPFLYRFQRLWLVTAVESRGRAAELLTDRFVPVEEVELPGLTVSLFEVPQGMSRWEMLEGLSQAVLVQGDSDPCPWRQDRFRCVARSMPEAKVELREVAGGPRRCLLLRPAPAGEDLMVRFPALDREGMLLVRAGNTVEAARSKDGGSVRVTVEVDGAEAGEMVLERRSYRFDAVQQPIADGPHDVVIRLTAEDERKREVCLDGFVLAPDALP